MNKIKEYLPLISAFLLMVGAVRLIYYYSYFGIDITSYIDLSEILILSFPFFINSAFILVVSVLLLTPMMIGEQLKFIETEKAQNFSDTIKERVVISFVVFAIMLVVMYQMYTGYADFTLTYDMIIALSLMFIFHVLLNYLMPTFRQSVKRAFNIEVDQAYFIILIIGIGVVTLSVMHSRHTARNVLFKRSYVIAEAQIDTLKVISGSDYRYVGKTKNYVFFYNTNKSTSEAWPLTNVKKFIIVDDHKFDGILFDPQIDPHKADQEVKDTVNVK